MALASLGVLLILAASPAFAGDVELDNASFEEPGDAPAGWTRGVGAHHGSATPTNQVVVDRGVAKDGKASLRCAGDASTKTWHMFTQGAAAVSGGERVVLQVAVRSRSVVRQRPQYPNANGLLIFKDADGKRLGLVTTPQVWGDREWVDLTVHAIAPAGTARVDVGVFASMTGTVWFDDVRLSVTSGAATDAEDRKAAFDALARHLRGTYPFWGIAGRPDLDEMLERHEKAIVAARDEEAFLKKTARMLDELQDVHVYVRARSGQWLSKRVAGPAVRVSPDPLDVLWKEGVKNIGGLLTDPGPNAIGYLFLPTFQLDEAQRTTLEEGIDRLLGKCGSLIIELRLNGGGDETIAQRIAGRFVTEPVVYARHTFRDPSLLGLDGFYPQQQRVLRPHPDGKRFEGKVVVLQGPGCVSSAEGFLQMMKAIPTATLVGRPSRGASGNPGAFEVLPGVSIMISRWRSLMLDGTCIEGVGVPPDVVVEPAKDPAKRDAALEKALELLSE